jgi:hypothetical protein
MSRKLETSRKRRVIEFLILGGLFFSVINAIIYFRNEPKYYIDIIKSSYKGIITEKYYDRISHVKVRTNTNERIDVISMAIPFHNRCAVGDSIEKLPGDDSVILRRKDSVIKLPYVYIPDNIRNDGRWPKEWKDKWIMKR